VSTGPVSAGPECAGPTVALVNPQLVSSGWGWGSKPRHMDDVLPRHSLLFLAKPLKDVGCRVELVDLRLLSGWDEYESMLGHLDPDFVCVTAHTSESEVALECCQRARRVVPRARTVAGGIHFTMYPHLGEEEGWVDYVVRGEGEITLPRLVREPERFQRVVWGEPPDLDRIPFEHRELYADYADRTRFQIWDLPTPIVDVLTKRGCPWQCRFCCGPGEQNLYTRPSPRDPERRLPTFRHRSVANVIEELEELHRRYAFRGVIFHDDQFVIRREWVEEFCAALHAHGFVERGIRWWAASRADVICRDPELFARMRDAGLQIVSIGFEAFTDRMLRWMRKDTTREENFEAARICHELGLDLFANVIFGMPFSDGKWYLEDDLASLAAIEEIRPRYFSPAFFSPIPGSWFYDWAVENDLLVAAEGVHTGRRTPDEAKIRGVDYATLQALLDDYRWRHEPAMEPKKPLHLRLHHFLRKPWPEKVEALRRRLPGAAG
jgi:anaerobic magnesium-protoporphyrin IX monomethyl ester cyclase